MICSRKRTTIAYTRLATYAVASLIFEIEQGFGTQGIGNRALTADTLVLAVLDRRSFSEGGQSCNRSMR